MATEQYVKVSISNIMKLLGLIGLVATVGIAIGEARFTLASHSEKIQRLEARIEALETTNKELEDTIRWAGFDSFASRLFPGQPPEE